MLVRVLFRVYIVSHFVLIQLPDGVFLTAVSGLVKTPKEFSRGARMIYLLRNLGANISVQNEVRSVVVVCDFVC